jgi:hypothetical protein
VQIERTPHEAIVSGSAKQLADFAAWLLDAKVGDEGGCHGLQVRVVPGRGFLARWSPGGVLEVDVGDEAREPFAGAFIFQCEPIAGLHNHFDPPAHPEEVESESVPLVVAMTA